MQGDNPFAKAAKKAGAKAKKAREAGIVVSDLEEVDAAAAAILDEERAYGDAVHNVV